MTASAALHIDPEDAAGPLRTASGEAELLDRIGKLENIVWALLAVIEAGDMISRHLP